MNFPPATIRLPSYLLSEDELRDTVERLLPFANGCPDHTDEPCSRAAECIEDLRAELRKRGQVISF